MKNTVMSMNPVSRKSAMSNPINDKAESHCPDHDTPDDPSSATGRERQPDKAKKFE
jgi:hypothetical protein